VAVRQANQISPVLYLRLLHNAGRRSVVRFAFVPVSSDGWTAKKAKDESSDTGWMDETALEKCVKSKATAE
jgi:hypothetical protein